MSIETKTFYLIAEYHNEACIRIYGPFYKLEAAVEYCNGLREQVTIPTTTFMCREVPGTEKEFVMDLPRLLKGNIP